MLKLHAPLLLTTDRLVGKSMLHQLLCYTEYRIVDVV